MSIMEFVKDHERYYSIDIKAEIQSRLVMRALRKEEPGVVIQSKPGPGSTMYVIMFDDGPELWLKTVDSVNEALAICTKYEIRISKVDCSHKH